jgi:hypothetical protein
MAHWSDPYVDIPYAQLDCAELVEKVLREVFSREIRFPRKQSSHLVHRSRLITRHTADFARPVAAPFDGAGVLIFARGRVAHVALYCAIAEQGFILHSDSSFGASIRQPLQRVATTHRIEGFYAWLD